MYNLSHIHIDLDRVLRNLFCVYAFSLPFELALEILFDIDTIFKPFRIMSLIIIGVFVIRIFKIRLYLNPKDKTDLLLYAVFIYGILISFVRIIGGVFNFGLFYNDLFQFGLHIASFFIFKAIPYSQKQMLKLFKWFFFGMLTNAGYIFTEFVIFGHHGRQAGFTDNPNYGSLGLVAGIIFLMLQTNYIRRFWKQIVSILLILFLTYIFIIEGSRTGLVMLIIANIFFFFFSTFRKKVMVLIISGLIVLLIIPQNLDKVTVGGGPLILVARVMYDIEHQEEDVRFVVWRGVFRTLEDVGYMGMGIGQFKAKFAKYYSEEPNELILEMVNRGYFLSTHNDYLAILTDYGVPSLLFYISYLFFTLKKVTRRMLYPEEDPESQMIHRLAFILFCCLIVFGIAAENFQHPLFWFLLAFSTKNFIRKQSLMELNT